MGNLTTKNGIPDNSNSLGIENKLSLKIIEILNKKYKIGDLDKNILIKRAFCTGKHQIPINLPVFDDNTNSIKEYTISVPVYGEDGNILTELDVKPGLKYDETESGLTVQYGKISQNSVVATATEGCKVLYTGNSSGFESVKDNEVETLKTKDSLCGAILDERQTLPGDKQFHGAFPLSSNNKGNEFVINPYPECSCVLSPWKLKRSIFFTPGSLGSFSEPYEIAQMFDTKCPTSIIDFGAITTNVISGDINVCVNNVTVANNIIEDDFAGKGDISTNIECNNTNETRKNIDFKPNIIDEYVGTSGGSGAEVTLGPSETKQPDVGPLPTLPSDLIKEKNKNVIITATILTVIVSILLLIIAKELL